MSGNAPLLTTDWRLPGRHTAHIPDLNPGIVILRNEGPASITINDIRDILANVKALLKDWHLLPYNNSIIEITQSKINVKHVNRGNLLEDLDIRFSASIWEARLLAALQSNSSFVPQKLTPPKPYC